MSRALRPFGKSGGWRNRGRFQPSRLQQRAQNTLGIIMTDDMNHAKEFRKQELDRFDAYYENRAYDDLQEWSDAQEQRDYVSIRKRKPRVTYNIARVLANKVASKLVGMSTFPKFIVEDNPDDTQFFDVVQKASGFRRNMLDPIKHLLVSGSVFVRYYFMNGRLCMEWANAKYCYPTLNAYDELEQIEIRYPYESQEERDQNGRAKKRWYKIQLGKQSDILFDNPEYFPGVIPVFKQVAENRHGFGWVQGEWFRTEKHKFDPDGYSIIQDIIDFIDDLNYSLSQSSQAISYNQEPILAINGVDEDEIDQLIRSSQKAWSLGREGKAEPIETDLGNVTIAEENRDHSRQRMLDVVRVVLHDPEKIIGAAQSAKAMEVMHGPLVELIDELRTIVEPSFENLLIKMGMSFLLLNQMGQQTMLTLPKGYQPQSLDIMTQWPAIFPLTLEDLQKKAQVCQVLTSQALLSRETAIRWIGPDVGVQDAQEEIEKIEEQPLFNPFGGWGPGEADQAQQQQDEQDRTQEAHDKDMKTPVGGGKK